MITTELDRYEYTGNANPVVFRSDGTDIPIRNTAHVKVYVTTTGDFTVDTTDNHLDDTAHGHITGQQITLSSTSSLPTGLLANTIYYVVNPTLNTNNSFQVALTEGGDPVTISTAGSGTLTWTKTLLKTITTDYTVALVGTTATVTWESGKVPGSSDKVLFLRDVTFEQVTDLQNNSQFEAESVEGQLDLMVNMSQQLKNTSDRQFRFSNVLEASDATEASATLTATKAGRADKGLRFDSLGNLGVSTVDIDLAQDYILEAKSWSIEDGIVQTYDKTVASNVSPAEYSSKEYAQGDAPGGSSKEWAQDTSAAVDTTFSAKEYAQGTQASTGGSSKNWASQTGADITGGSSGDKSAKSWAIEEGGTAPADGSAKEWATDTGGVVADSEFSAKAYASEVGANAPTVGSAKEWATATGSAVASSEFSAKEYSQGVTATGGTAKQWALGGGSHVEATEVTSGLYSARKYASNASASASASAASASAAEGYTDAFDDRYLGSKSSVPTLDNDGNTLTDGALYYNTTSNIMYVYDLGTTTWIALTIGELTTTGFAAATLVTQAEGIASNDNETTIPTSAAVKDYVDSNHPSTFERVTVVADDSAYAVNINQEHATGPIMKLQADGTDVLVVNPAGPSMGIGSGIADPTALFHIYDSSADSDAFSNVSAMSGTLLLIEDTAGAIIELLTKPDGQGEVKFTHGDTSDYGQIRYNHNTDAMYFSVNSAGDSTEMTINSGSVVIPDVDINGGTIDGVTSFNGTEISTSADNNLGIGVDALDSITTGDRNVALGDNALTACTEGGYNSAVGYKALDTNITGDNNSAFGYYALQLNTADSNSAFGYYALGSNSTGRKNSAFGLSALYANTEGIQNSAFGWNALNLSTGSNNTAIGYAAGNNITSGSSNIIIGADIDADSATGDDQLNIGNTIYGDLSTGDIWTTTTGKIKQKGAFMQSSTHQALTLGY